MQGLGSYSNYYQNSENIGIQTEDFGILGDSLDVKMKGLDAIFRHQRSKNAERDEDEVEDRIVSFQERLETIMKMDMEQQVILLRSCYS